MCQLLGMNCNTPTDIVFSFTGFSQRAGKTGDHVDGWGIAFFEQNGIRHFVDHNSATDSEIAKFIKNYPIKSKNVISHIRKATKGKVKLENCHPFVRELWGKYWVFAHNGNLDNYSPTLSGRFNPVGQTDSELAFCWIMQNLAEQFKQQPTNIQLTQTLQKLADQIANFGIFNFMLANNEVLFCYSTTKLHFIERGFPFNHAQLSDDNLSIDFSEHTTPQDKVAVIVTEPLTNNEQWTQLEHNKIYMFSEGKHQPY